jgi:hypothetical protein
MVIQVAEQILLLCVQGDLCAVPQAFHAARHEDVLAVVDLSHNSYGSNRHAISSSSILAAQLMDLTSKLLRGLMPRPALSLMNQANMRYSEIKQLQEQQQRLVDAVSAALGLGAASWQLLAWWCWGVAVDG